MTFISAAFVILFLVTYLLCRAVKKENARHCILLAASYVFYAYWDVRFLFLLLFQTFVSYLLALRIEEAEERKKAKAYAVAGVACSLIILGFFKYFNFFIDTADRLFGVGKNAVTVILPVGISFYTFQALSYLIDVYRGEVRARKSFVKVSLYISFFPQLVAGPIVRSGSFLPQLDEERKMSREALLTGAQIFLFGLVKKTVIANRLSVCVDAVYRAPEAFSSFSIALAAVAYTIQIYCDFSGYSDMAAGVAKVFGYDLCRNFNIPYAAGNMTEFWRRWHISLSEWLRDYLYIPLGGNRKGRFRSYFNLMATMTLGGLWHGAGWHFVIWGMLQGAALVIHKASVQWRKTYGIACKTKAAKRIVSFLSTAGTYVFVCLTFIFFRAESSGKAWLILTRLFSGAEGVAYIYVYSVIYTILVLACHLAAVLKNRREGFYPLVRLNRMSGQFAVALVILLVMMFCYAGNTAFIYFQF